MRAALTSARTWVVLMVLAEDWIGLAVWSVAAALELLILTGKTR